MEQEALTIALQKSGRLSEKSLWLLSEAGIHLENGSSKHLQARATNFPLQVIFLRDDDIPECVADGAASIGIVGLDVVEEKRRAVHLVEKLGLARCRLSIALPRQIPYQGPASLEGKRIATAYPGLLQRFLNRYQVRATIHEISGSVELAPGIGLADAICDIVSTGSTLLANGLREVEVILESEAVLIRHPHLSPTEEELFQEFLFRIRAVLQAQQYRYILLNAPNEAIPQIVQILPGMKSPTVMPLAEPGWSSLHSVVREDEFWEVIEQLKQAGAQGILVVPIEKMIF